MDKKPETNFSFNPGGVYTEGPSPAELPQKTSMLSAQLDRLNRNLNTLEDNIRTLYLLRDSLTETDPIEDTPIPEIRNSNKLDVLSDQNNKFEVFNRVLNVAIGDLTAAIG